MVEWRAVVGFEGQYEVSSDGRVRRVARELMRSNGHSYRVREKELSQIPHERGYLLVGLKVARKTNRTRLVHVLVAQAFILNPDNLPEVNHLDLDKTNNRVGNLEWATEKDNHAHARAAGRFHGRTNANARFKLQPEQVDATLCRAAAGEKQIDLAAEYGVSNTLISLIVNGKCWVDPMKEAA